MHDQPRGPSSDSLGMAIRGDCSHFVQPVKVKEAMININSFSTWVGVFISMSF